ncbi:SART-1 protein [Chytriomyces sp. MP71]|nr:SART-1 protein [Chytriomyces sp. MP71]
MSKAEAEGEPVTEELSLSVEETNRLRISLGLKPLQNETSSGGDAAVAAANFAKEKQRLKARQERKLLISRLAAAENKEKAFARLEGKGLGDADDDNDDNTSALAWAAKLKERNETNRRMLVQRKARELEELDEEYSADQLKGLRVAHNMDDISSDILVLADKRVTDEDADEDELVSAAISAKERLEQNLKNKKKKPVYNAYDDAEFDMPGHKRSLLSQYDEDDEKSGFILGDGGRVDSAAAAATEGESQANGKKTVTLAYEKMQEIKDYYTQEEAAATFLKPKKKKKSSSSSKGKSRTRDVEPDYPNPANPDAMQTDAVAIGSGTTHDFARSNANADVTSVNFVDDDDLQSALSRARNMANRALKRPTTQEMLQAAQEIEAQELAAEINTRRAAADSNSDDEEADEEDAALVMSSTSEFVNNLRTAATLAPSRAGAGPAVQGRPRVREAESDDEEEEERTRAAGRMDIDATEEKEGAKSGDEDDDEDGGGWREPGETSSGTGLLHAEIGEEEAVEDGNLEGGGIEEEPLVAAGMAATVALLNKQGFLEKVGDDLLDRERKQKDRAKWLAEQRVQEKKREIIKEREKQRQREINKAKGPQGKKGGGGGGGGGNSERKEEDDWRAEEEARAAERRQLREVEERFKNYNPDIEIKYNDDWGNPLSQKEVCVTSCALFHCFVFDLHLADPPTC